MIICDYKQKNKRLQAVLLYTKRRTNITTTILPVEIPGHTVAIAPITRRILTCISLVFQVATIIFEIPCNSVAVRRIFT